jgi:hypothetical protein
MSKMDQKSVNAAADSTAPHLSQVLALPQVVNNVRQTAAATSGARVDIDQKQPAHDQVITVHYDQALNRSRLHDLQVF